MTSERACKRLNLPSGTPYINSGVMLMNLEKMRADAIESNLFDYIKNTKKSLDNVDQDVINDVLFGIKNGIKQIQQNWNTEVRPNMPPEKDYAAIIENPYIIHYVTKDKPWKEGTKQRYKERYWKYNSYVKEKTEDAKKIGVVYTCITGNYDDLSDHSYISPDWDYVCFTDNQSIRNNNNLSWNMRSLSFDRLDGSRNQRWHKLHPHTLFPDYQNSFWVDANIDILKKDVFDDVDNAMGKGDLISIALHPFRNCIYEELDACIERGKDDSEVMREQVGIMKKDGFPRRNGLFETNLIFRKHNDKKVIKIMEDWWQWIRDYSKRDQLSFTYVLWKNNFIAKPLAEISYREKDGRMAFRDHNPVLRGKVSDLERVIQKRDREISEIKSSFFWTFYQHCLNVEKIFKRIFTKWKTSKKPKKIK